MNGEYLLLAGVLCVILAEVSYLVYVTARTNVRSKNTAMYVDTSVLMDGRILPIAETGFITADLVIPRSVIGELQLLADGGDNDKRARARYGLDIARKLRACDMVNVRILADNDLQGGVDDRLLALAKKYGGMVCTIDYNLNKVAQVEGIAVVNVNELAKNVRLAYLPGDKVYIDLVQKGQDNHQGVGYLEDGTMVVVENASKYIGKKVQVEIIRALQTDAGRMMFARIATISTRVAAQKTSETKRAITKKVTTTGRKPAVEATKTARVEKSSEKKKPKKTAHSSSAARAQAAKSTANRHPQQKRRTGEDRLLDLVESQR